MRFELGFQPSFLSLELGNCAREAFHRRTARKHRRHCAFKAPRNLCEIALHLAPHVHRVVGEALSLGVIFLEEKLDLGWIHQVLAKPADYCLLDVMQIIASAVLARPRILELRTYDANAAAVLASN